MNDTACCTGETCYTCRFWLEKSEWAANDDRVIDPSGIMDGAPVARVDGQHFILKPYDRTGDPQWRGFGGHEFTFRFTDGREVVSNDVWCQGDIPARFRGRLPDNAVIVSQQGGTRQATVE
ncbi:hypothetical protein [Streptomyces sp. NPDC058985]|uniref:hypothetical protein n=1 Tax=Streptomyces sp. NPDC058985 TaxID=3346684 RepID=UPI00367D475F